MSSEVVDSNPYSRLMALQRMGIVKDYERIRDKTVRACGGERAPGSACSSRGPLGSTRRRLDGPLLHDEASSSPSPASRSMPRPFTCLPRLPVCLAGRGRGRRRRR
jgi:hypothetical protein